MRVILDTNVLVSSLFAGNSAPALLAQLWLKRRFTLLTCSAQLVELHSTLHKPAVLSRADSHEIGRLFNRVRRRAILIAPLPTVRRSFDPTDDFLLALAEAGKADYIVSGDKSGLLALRKHANARIMSARDFLNQLA